MEHGADQTARLYFEDATAGKWGGIRATYGTGGATKEISLAPGDGTGDARFGGLAVTPTTATVGGAFQDTDLIVSGGGQVGIGTSTPGSYKLNVLSAGFFLGRFATTGTSGAVYVGTQSGSAQVQYYDSGERLALKAPGRMEFNIGDGSAAASFRWNNAQDPNNEQMRLATNGALGIGTDAPDKNLEVAGTAPTIRITDTQQKSWTKGDAIGQLEWYTEDQSGTGARVAASIDVLAGNTAVQPYANMQFSLSGVSTTEQPIMTLTNAGNVGIGTTNPNWIASGTQTSQGVLSLGTSDTAVVTGDVIGALSFVSPDGSYTAIYNDGVGAQIAAVTESSVGGSYGLAFSTGTTTGTNRAERVRIDAVGNVGIGDTSRLSFLTNPSGNLQLTGGLISDPGAGIPLEIANYRSEPITFSTSGNIERMRIDSSGNVGVGTITADSRLHVSPSSFGGNQGDVAITLGNEVTTARGARINKNTSSPYDLTVTAGLNPTNGSDLVFESHPGVETMRLTKDGNVGIGETVPARKLHVGDAMRLEPTSTPTSPSAGDLYFDSTTNKLRCYDGTTWQDCF
jgi:hypothetical protein